MVNNSIHEVNIRQENLRIKPEVYFMNNSMNTSPSMFVKESETLEQRLESPFRKLNIESSVGLETDGIPTWFRPEYNNLLNLATIQDSYSTYPFGNVPTGMIMGELQKSPPKSTFTTNDKLALMFKDAIQNACDRHNITF